MLLYAFVFILFSKFKAHFREIRRIRSLWTAGGGFAWILLPSSDTASQDSPTGSQGPGTERWARKANRLGLASWNLSDGNKLSFARLGPAQRVLCLLAPRARGSVRTQTMPIPRSTFFSSESIEVPSVEEDLSASTPASREASVERSPRPVVSRPASPTSPTASPKAKSKGRAPKSGARVAQEAFWTASAASAAR